MRAARRLKESSRSQSSHLAASERPVLDSVQHVLWIVDLRDQLQVADQFSDRHQALWCANQTPEDLARLLPAPGLDKQVLVLAYEHAAQGGGAVEQVRVR